MHKIDLTTLTLEKGNHPSFEEGACLLEAVAYVAGEPHSDHPDCASPILGTFGRALNDVLPDDKRQRLVPLIPLIVGTTGDGHDQARGLMAADWLIRTYTPTWLRLAGLTDAAQSLETLPRQATWDDVQAAVPTVRAAKQKAAAARAAAWTAARAAARDAARAAARAAAQAAAQDAAQDAAWDAAWAAAQDAAWAAAGDAARATAWDAAGDAAWAAARAAAWDAAGDAAWAAARAAAQAAAQDAAQDAAWDAAGDAAWAAAQAALQPTVDALQVAAIDLYERMVTVGSEQ